MATGGEEQVCYSLANVGTITLDNTNKRPDYNSIVFCQNKIIVLDSNDHKVIINRLQDGKFLDMLDSNSRPRDICLLDATTICVLHDDGLIEMASIKSENVKPVFTRMKSFQLHGIFDSYESVVRVKDDIVVVGVKQDTTYWCIVSLDDGHVDTIHRICKKSTWSDVTTKDNIIYISCYAGVADADTGVYAFDILNPSECKYEYKHQRLRYLTSIVINEDGNIFVGNYGVFDNSSIHQLTASCQLVSIFTQGIPQYLQAMLWDNGRLYVAFFESPYITVFRHVYQVAENHTDSEVPISNEGNELVIEGTSTQVGQEIVDNGQSSVDTERPSSGPSHENSEDDTQGNHTDLEVPISDEGKQPVIELTATQIRQKIVDNGQSSVKTEMPPSGLSPKNSEEENEASEVQISDEGKQSVIEGTSTQIGQEIPTEQSVEAGIEMSPAERILFIQFQNKIGTDIYFSKGLHRSRVGQETLEATDTFFAKSRPDMMDKWLEYKSQGKLTPELIDVIYAKERYPELHANKDKFLEHMEDLNIIVKGRTFDENGVKEENYFFTACMLRPKSEREVIAPDQDPLMLSTTLCWDFTGMYVPYFICDRILSSCIARWPVAKKKDTSEHLISHGYAVFDLDCIHRLTLTFENHVFLAAITWLVVDNIKTPDATLCTIVRMFISQTLAKIINSLNQNIQYELCLQRPDSRIHFAPYQMWFEDEIHDPDSPIKREHMNHARLCIALVTVCGKALREMLVDNFPVPCLDIYQAILANYAKLTGEQGKPLLDEEQIKLVFSDPLGQKTGTVDMFDLSLLYKLIRNVSRVQPPINGWGKDPNQWETSLGASVERIRKYRNDIGGHSPDAKIEDTKFNDYWKMFEDVLHDIETAINKKEVYSEELDRQKRQVISVFDAC